MGQLVSRNEAPTKSDPEADLENGLQLDLEHRKQREAKVAEETAARLRLYRRDDVRRLAGWLLKGHEDAQPQLNRESGSYAYSGVEFGLGDISALLAELESHGILRRYIADTVPACSACGHSNFQVVYLCPFSQHSTLELGTMVEHYACGYTDFEDKFKIGNELICPKCRRKLKMIGSDYRKVERLYQCNGCGKHFGRPKLQFPCRSCGKTNFEDEMVMRPIYGYLLNQGIRGELTAHCTLEAKVTQLFEESGFEVKAPTTLQGLSGVSNDFDLGTKKEEIEIVLDMISAAEEVGPKDVVAFFAKVFDSKPPKALLIAMPRISREARKLAAMYGIEVIAAEEPDEIIEGLAALPGLRSSIAQEGSLSGHAQGPLKHMERELLELDQKSSPKGESSNEEQSSDEILRSALVKTGWVLEEAERRTSS